MRAVETEKSIRQIVRSAVEAYANGFETRHIGEIDNPNGVINMKIHNVFISALGKEIQYYASLVRSLDSSMGYMLESMAINIAKLFYEVTKSVEGELYPEQTAKIAELLEGYKNSKNDLKPLLSHYDEIKNITSNAMVVKKVHISDYYLFDKQTDTHHLIELKIGGDLDNKKARIGQSFFRKSLLKSLNKCPFTNINNPRLLIASHIKPWSKSDNIERLDIKNGFIFTPTFDLLFDKGYISFKNDKSLVISEILDTNTIDRLSLRNNEMIDTLPINGRVQYLEYHRDVVLKRVG